MDGCSLIKQTLDRFTTQFYPHFEKYKSCISKYPLASRVTIHWKIILSDCSTIIAVSCCAITFFGGSAMLCSAFAIIAISSGVSSFYMRHFSRLTDLETTAKKLKDTKDEFAKVARDLTVENNRLLMTNRELQHTNEAFRTTNRELQTANDTFRQSNERLTNQVARLTVQTSEICTSAERIRKNMIHFQQGNSHLHSNIQGFDQSLHSLNQQILGSRALCEQIENHFTQQQGLGQQLKDIRNYLENLHRDTGLHEKIQALATLQENIRQSTEQLHTLQMQYATERTKFQAVHETLVKLKEQFDTAIRNAVSDLGTNNQQFRDSLSSYQKQFNDMLASLSTRRQND
jgi:methyl-accepting chemotaxis protein